MSHNFLQGPAGCFTHLGGKFICAFCSPEYYDNELDNNEGSSFARSVALCATRPESRVCLGIPSYHFLPQE